jgi:hypothetical protein
VRHVWFVLIFGALAAPAAAQTAASGTSAAPSGRLFLGAGAGVAAVQNVGGVVDGQIGYKLTSRADVIGEVSWMQDIVTRRRLNVASDVSSFLQASQGKPATSTVEAPAVYTGASLRLQLARGTMRPYVSVGGGVARLSLQPTFTLAGSDVTTSLPQYGVTLGSDLTGEVTKPAVTGAVGLMFDRHRWYVDGALRLTSIQTEGQATNVIRVGAGIGVRF